MDASNLNDWERRTLRKSHQVRALGRKALSYQKRQCFTNVCCIGLCPLFMVAISAVLGGVFTALIKKAIVIEDVLFCGNADRLNHDGFPIFDRTDYRITAPKIVNFMYVLNLAGSTNNPGAVVLNTNHPCVYWFGEDFPQNDPIYEKNANLSGLAKADSTYTSPPNDGWSGLFQKALSTGYQIESQEVSTFAKLQLASWAIYAARDGLQGVLGANPQQPLLDVTQLQKLAVNLAKQNQSYPAFSTDTTSATYGLLGTIEPRYYFNFSLNIIPSNDSLQLPTYAPSFSGLQQVPYYVPLPKTQGAVPEDLDDQIVDRLNQLLLSLAALDKSVLNKANASDAEIAQFELNASAKTAIMPYGAVYLDAYNAAQLSAKIYLQFGTDKRVQAAATYPSQGQRQFTQMTQLNQALLRSFNSSFATSTITQGLRAFPEKKSTDIDIPISALIGRILYPFGVSFLLPIFVIILVKEKEDRIFMMMKINGMKAWAYFLSHYVTFYVLFAVSSIIFIISGRFSRLDLFTKTQLGVILVLFFVWGHVQIALAFFFSAIFNKNRIALVLVFLLVLCGVIIGIVLDSLFRDSTVPMYLYIWPPFAFYRALSLVNLNSYNALLVPYTLSMITPGDEVYGCIIAMIISVPIYFLIYFYLNAVLPSEFGIRKPWHFPITEPINAYQKNQRKKANGGIDPLSELNLATAVKIDDEETKFEDADVKAERERVSSGAYPRGSPIVISHMRKVFAGRRGLGPKLAVKDVTFAAEKDLIFGLLGPNGAGKTTLISILTGLIESSSGQAMLAGFNYRTETEKVYKLIGVCPQFDILWDDLTVGEHLYFYARLNGIPIREERAAVQAALANVSLQTLENRLTKGLSGGEKRRLSIAIALIGDPAVVFLDEPTTGLDPEVRRLIWNIITNAKEGKTVILTTHSMEEAEALCQRIGIMAKGTLRCLANPLRLKELYGSGFKLFFNSKEEDTEAASAWIETLLPDGWRKVDDFATNVSYEFPSIPGIISKLFNTVEEGKGQHGITDWGISQTTLEEVFLKIISDDDANAD